MLHQVLSACKFIRSQNDIFTDDLNFTYSYIFLNYFRITQVMKSRWVSYCLCAPQQLSLILKNLFYYFLLFLIQNPDSLMLPAVPGPCPL